MVYAHPGTVRGIFAEGHTIGTHSEDHPLRFGKLPSSLVEWEIDKGILDVGTALGDSNQVAHFFVSVGREGASDGDYLCAGQLTHFSAGTLG